LNTPGEIVQTSYM